MKLKMILAACLMSTAAMAQTDPVVMTVNGVNVTRSEFEYSFNKNNSDGVIDKKGIEEYADLYAIRRSGRSGDHEMYAVSFVIVMSAMKRSSTFAGAVPAT